jgi:hypothetical protein
LNVETQAPGHERPGPCHQRKTSDMSDTNLIQVTDAADSALGAFDFSAHEGKGIRVFVQGFG